MDPNIIVHIIESVDTWPRAMVAVTLVIAIALYLILRRTQSDVKEVKDSLTKNNGGSHIKDAMDAQTQALERIEATLGDVVTRVETLESKASQVKTARGFFRLR